MSSPTSPPPEYAQQPGGTSQTLPCLPCRAAAAAAVWTAVVKAQEARSPRGQRSPPSSSAAERGGGGRNMSAMDLVAFGCGCLNPGVGTDAAALHGYSEPPRCGQKHWEATPGAQPLTAGVVLRRSPAAQEVPLAGCQQDGCSQAPARSRLRRLAGGRTGQQPPPPSCAGSTHPVLPGSAGRSGLGRFRGLGSPSPRAGGGQAPRPRGRGGGRPLTSWGGVVHQRAAGEPKSGRTWEAGRDRPSQEDSAARRSCGARTWRRGATRGGAAGHRKPAAEPPCPSCPAR